MQTRRQFLGSSSVSVLGAAIAAPAARAEGGSAAMLQGDPAQPKPATFDRLPLEWHKAAVKRLQQKLGERGLDGILLTDRWNIIYYTGLFHTSTERPFACFIPTRDVAVHWFYPNLDAELVKSWWITDADYYYDYPHAEGGYPDQGRVAVGKPVDLVEWRLKGLAKRGYAQKRIGLDEEPSASTLERMTTTSAGSTRLPATDFSVRLGGRATGRCSRGRSSVRPVGPASCTR